MAQVSGVLLALAQILLLTRALPTVDYAHYGVVTAIWGVANAAVGTGIGTRVARDTANGNEAISLRVRDLALVVLMAAGSGVWFFVTVGNPAQSVAAGVAGVTFVLVEARTSHELGARRYWTYLYMMISRMLIPLIFTLSVWLWDPKSLNLTVVMLAIAAGNAYPCIFAKWSWRVVSAGDHSHANSVEFVGAINLGLWVIAGTGRIVLEAGATITDLAMYTLAAGLIDRAYRSLQSAYISRNIADAFAAGTSGRSRVWLVSAVCMGFVTVAALPLLCDLFSGGRYVPSYGLSVALSASGVLLILTGPLYLEVVSSSLVWIGSICALVAAAACIGLSIVLVQFFRMGATGAAIALAATYVGWLLMLFGIARASRRLERDALQLRHSEVSREAKR